MYQSSLQNSEINSPKVSHFTQAKYYPWFVIFLCASLLFYKYVLSVSPSGMTDELMRDFQQTGVGLGNIGAVFYYTYTITQLFVGVMMDRYSTRLLAALSVAISALGALLFAEAHSMTVLLLARALMGFGAAFATVTYLKMAAVWFSPCRLAFVNGLLASAVMIGAVCGVAPLASMVTWIGWRETILLVAFLGFFVALIFMLCIRDRPSDQTADAFVPSNHKLKSQDLLTVIRNPQNWMLTAYNGLAFVPVTIFAGLWGNPFLRALHHDLSSAEAGWLVSVVFIGLGLGAPLLGLVSDQMGKRKPVMMLGLVISLLALLMVIYVPAMNYGLLVCMLFLFGFGTGAFMLVFSIGRMLNPLFLAATVIAMINTGELLNAVTEPLIGKFLDLSWHGEIVDGIHIFAATNYQYAFSVLPLYILLGMVLWFFIREEKSN